MDIILELLRFYERIDTKKRWLVDPDEAVELTLAEAAIHLRKDTLNDYFQHVLTTLETKAYERLDGDTVGPLNIKQEDELFNILEKSVFCSLGKKRVDFSKETEVILTDGKIIPINSGKDS